MTANGGSQQSKTFVGVQFGDATSSCPADLGIIVSLHSPGEPDFTVSLSNEGVELDFHPPADLHTEKYIAPRAKDKIQLLVNRSRNGSLHTVKLPGRQELLIGELPEEVTVEINILRISNAGTSLTNSATISFSDEIPTLEFHPAFAEVTSATKSKSTRSKFSLSKFAQPKTSHDEVVDSSADALAAEEEPTVVDGPVTNEVASETNPAATTYEDALAEFKAFDVQAYIKELKENAALQKLEASVSIPDAVADNDREPFNFGEFWNKLFPRKSQDQADVSVVAVETEEERKSFSFVKFFEKLKSRNADDVVDEISTETTKDSAEPGITLRIRLSQVLRSIAAGLIIFVVLLVITPLNLVHATQPNSQTHNIAIVWTKGTAAKGQTIAAATAESEIFIGQVADVVGDNMVLTSGSDYAQAPISSFMGRVLFRIPLLGYLLP